MYVYIYIYCIITIHQMLLEHVGTSHQKQIHWPFEIPHRKGGLGPTLDLLARRWTKLQNCGFVWICLVKSTLQQQKHKALETKQILFCFKLASLQAPDLKTRIDKSTPISSYSLWSLKKKAASANRSHRMSNETVESK